MGSKDKTRPYSVASSDRTRGNGLKMKYKKSHLNLRKIFYWVITHWNRLLPAVMEEPSLGMFQNCLHTVLTNLP